MVHPKKKYGPIRKEFNKDLNFLLKDDVTLSSLIYMTLNAKRMRSHVYKIWELLGRNHREAYDAYNDTLFGQMLTGSESIWWCLNHIGKDFSKKWSKIIPESYAFGDAFAIANKYRLKKYYV
jgi:hypothetical protein